MKHSFLTMFALSCMLLPGFSSADEGSAPDGEGWVKLFDGETLDGWMIRSGKATYKVEDGAIAGTTEAGSPNTFLISDKTFGDFELQFDVLLEDNPLNSGVQRPQSELSQLL